MTSKRVFLQENEIPTAWYNLQADLPKPLPAVLHPGTHQPVGPDDLAPLFPMELILQEVSTEREIEIPEPVRDAYAIYRPSPLHRAHRLEQALATVNEILVTLRERAELAGDRMDDRRAALTRLQEELPKRTEELRTSFAAWAEVQRTFGGTFVAPGLRIAGQGEGLARAGGHDEEEAVLAFGGEENEVADEGLRERRIRGVIRDVGVGNGLDEADAGKPLREQLEQRLSQRGVDRLPFPP